MVKQSKSQQILVSREEALEITDNESLDGFCPDCDCVMEQFYDDDESGNSKYLCDNCGLAMPANRDITK